MIKILEYLIPVFLVPCLYCGNPVKEFSSTALNPNAPIENAFTDADGNAYSAIQIGNQVWAIENLRTTKYNDGTPIPDGTKLTQWDSLTTDAYCNMYNESLKDEYGLFYNWYAINTGKLAPAGWHVPTIREWDTLQEYLIANGYNWDGTTSGNKIAKSLAADKEWSSDPWIRPNFGWPGIDLSKNNASGFYALPCGLRVGLHPMGTHDSYWWSASECDSSTAWGRDILNSYEHFGRYSGNKSVGCSIRLLRD